MAMAASAPNDAESASDPRLLPLSSSLANAVTSSNTLSNIWSAVEICILHSIEAEATEIHIDLDIARCSFSIKDNGRGISPADMHTLGTSHHTRGNISAVCASSILHISSRPATSFETFSSILQAGRVIQQPRLAKEQRTRSGTVLSVCDLFFNRPVIRKKLLASTTATPVIASSSSSSMYSQSYSTATAIKKEIEHCREVVAGMSLVRPHITFTLYDRFTKSFKFKHINGSSPMSTLAEFFGTPAPELITDLTSTQTPIQTPLTPTKWSVRGWAVMPPYGHPTRARQRIFINGRAVKAPPLSHAVTALFTDATATILKQQARGEMLLSVQKTSNQYPMFVLDLQYRQYRDRGVEYVGDDGVGSRRVLLGDGDWEEVVVVVRQAVLSAWRHVLTAALLREHEEKQKQRKEEEEEGRMKKKRRMDTSGAFVFTYGAGARASAPAAIGRHHRAPPSPPTYSISTNKQPERHSLIPVVVEETKTTQTASKSTSLLSQWRHRRSALRHNLTSNHASSIATADVENLNTPMPKIHTAQASTHRRGLLAPHPPQPRPPPSTSSLDVILSTWQNPAMMPSTVHTTTSVDSILTLSSLRSALYARLCPESIDREDLLTAHALGQIDTKFIPIICRRKRGGSSVVALVDQHAADERVQLEKLRANVQVMMAGGVGGLPSMELQRPQSMSFGVDEVALLDIYKDVVMQWGWKWVVQQFGGSGAEAVVDVIAVPVIANRALTATDMRLYVHEVDQVHGGVDLVPSGVTRVLNSRACRSAVKFGDVLRVLECRELVDDLKRTQLCFICAHGRPTTAPLVDLGAVKRAVAEMNEKSSSGRRSRSNTSIRRLKDKLVRDLEMCG